MIKDLRQIIKLRDHQLACNGKVVAQNEEQLVAANEFSVKQIMMGEKLEQLVASLRTELERTQQELVEQRKTAGNEQMQLSKELSEVSWWQIMQAPKGHWGLGDARTWQVEYEVVSVDSILE